MRKIGAFFFILAILTGLVSSLSCASAAAAPGETAAAATSLTNDHYVLDFSKLQWTEAVGHHDDEFGGSDGPGGPGGRRHGSGGPGGFPDSVLLLATFLTVLIVLGADSVD